MVKRKNKKRYQEVEYYSLSQETKRGIIIIFLFIIALISILSFLSLAGQAGIYIDWGLGIAFGWGRFAFPVILIALGYVMAKPSQYQISIPNYIGITIFFLGLHGLLHTKIPFENSWELAFSGVGGGVVGYAVSYPLIMYLGFWASLIILIGILVCSFLLMFNTSLETIFAKTNFLKQLPLMFNKRQPSDNDNSSNEEETFDEENEAEYESQTSTDDESQTRVSGFRVSPQTLTKKESASGIRTQRIKIDLPISLLDDKKSKPTSGDIKMGAERIQKTLENFNIPVEMHEIQVGPTVTQYTLKPAEGIKLSKITTLSNDLALALAAHPIRIEAPIPGKSLVGIEVPNQKPAIVRIRELIESKEFKERKTNVTTVLGKDVSGKCWVDDISSMPHLLVAGSTGSGKSVCLNALLMSLLYENNPDTLRLILVDPKRVEFPVYNGIPHLLTPVITDVTKTVYALRWAITEMDRRFDVLAKDKKRNLESYNQKAKEKIPHIVIIIDELADLMVAAAAEVEGSIIRLTQMARAVGIHLVVATQRPSVDVITGLIKANIPCRIAFSVASLMDSRTILDSSGAEKLVGKGDMLYMTPRTSKPRRIQGAFVSDEEIKRVVDFLKNACDGEPDYQEEVTEKPNATSSFDFKGGSGDDGDELFEEAKNLILESGKASASYLQRRLRVGYARAARLIDLLEEAGIVGPASGAKPRDILIDKLSTRNPIQKQELIEESPSFDNFEDEEEDEPTEQEIDNEDLIENNNQDNEEQDASVFEKKLETENEIDEMADLDLESDDEFIEDEQEEKPTPRKSENHDDEIY